jgi:hypothetical protein
MCAAIFVSREVPADAEAVTDTGGDDPEEATQRIILVRATSWSVRAEIGPTLHEEIYEYSRIVRPSWRPDEG